MWYYSPASAHGYNWTTYFIYQRFQEVQHQILKQQQQQQFLLLFCMTIVHTTGIDEIIVQASPAKVFPEGLDSKF